MTRNVAIVGSAQRPFERHTQLTTVELLAPVIREALANAGLARTEVGFWCHGSCDYMSGQPFSFVAAVDAIGAWPPIVESHVEGDGALALYEAWIKFQTGECDTALVFANGKTTAGPIDRILTLQMDPYTMAPLWPGASGVAAVQARACLDGGVITERAMAEVVARSIAAGIANPLVGWGEAATVDELLARPHSTAPLRAHDIGLPADGAVAVVLAADDVARRLSARPAWIRGIDHRIDTQRLGAHSLTESASAAIAAHHAGVAADRIDVAELHAPFSHQELLLTSAMGLDPSRTAINPSGGALPANPQMAAGLVRFAEAANRIHAGSADRAVAHSTSGPCLQQNLVAVLEGE
ncbi:MAG: lipid-transfer protein [Actinomycetota bacterium]